MKNFLTSVFFILIVMNLMAIPPDPPLGKRWVVNHEFSDEFNGTTLDDTKWHDHHPQWIGRPPGLFISENVSVKDGYLQLRNYKMEKDTVIWNWNHTSTSTFNIAGAAVRSKSNQAYFGYYECKFKASKTRMSTTFWLSSDHTVSIPGCASGKEKYGLELDIQECIGVDDSPKTSTFHKGMHSNTHFHYTNCEGEKDTRSRGNGFDSNESCSDDFNVYAAWWKNENEVEFIFNNTQKNTVRFKTDILNKPFNFPMCMNMVTETYSWISTPRAENLNDESKNTSYYDWVRSYRLVNADEALTTKTNLIVNGDFETGTDSGWGGWGGNPREVVNSEAYEGSYCMHIAGAGAPEQTLNLQSNTKYTLTAYAKAVKGTVKLGVKNNETGIHLKDLDVTNIEYQKFTIDFTTDEGSSFKVFFYAPKDTDEGYIDKVEITDQSTGEIEETIMFPEEVNFTSKPALLNRSETVYFKGKYKANADREICIEIENDDKQVLASQIFPAYAGFGYKNFAFTEISILELNVAYTAKIYIRPLNSNNNSEAFQQDEFSFKFDPTASPSLNRASIKVFPNPSSSFINIEGIDNNTFYTIYTIDGIPVKKGKLSSQSSVEIGSLSTGVYVLQLNDKNYRFIKQE